jgi:UDP-2,4-diacetamido-2,4,6-trideoxy-beta-L-altropyranose hydrolase
VNNSGPTRFLFLADAGPQVGGGHVMRCLTLARALTTHHGAECAFVESRAAAPILRRFGWPAQTMVAMVGAESVGALVAHARDFAGLFDPQVIVIDHYGIGAAEEGTLRAENRALAVIDDLADRAHACDALIDPSFARRADAYAGLVPQDAALFAGPSYALVRPEFADARPRALSRRAKHGPVKRALVSLGLTDVGGVTARVVAALQPLLGEARLDVVLGSGAASLPRLEAAAQTDRRLHLWVDSAEMGSLMADADIAVGAGGSSVWERAVVGLPSVTLALAPNQAPMIGKMAEAGLTLAVGAEAPDFAQRLAAAWGRLTSDAALRWRLAEQSSELCDGHGAMRVAEAVFARQARAGGS